MDVRYRKLGVNTLLVFIGKVGSSLIGILLLPYYTSWLSVADYGTSDLVITYANVLVAFMSCCIYDSIFIFSKDAEEKDKAQLYSSGLIFITLNAILITLIIFFLSAVANQLGWYNVFFLKPWYVVILCFCSCLQQYTQSFTRGIDKMKVYSMTGIVFSIVMAISSLVMIPLWGLDGYLMSFIISNLFAVLFSIIISKSYKYLSLQAFDVKQLKLLLNYGIPIIPNGIMWWLVSGINRPMMENVLGLSAVGLFAIANKIPSVISIISSIFSSAWMITMLEEFKNKDFNAFFNRTIKRLFLVIVLVGIVIAIFSKLIISLVAADDYIEAWRIVPLLVYSVICQVMSGLIGGVFAAEKKSKYFFYSSFWGAAASLICTYFFMLWFELYGAAIAMICSFVVMTLARLKYAWKYISEFDFKFYICVSLLYLALSIICILEISMLWKCVAYIIIIGLILSQNKDDLVLVCRYIKNRIR